MKQEVSSYIFGDLDMSFLIAFWILGALGMVLSLVIHMWKKYRSNIRSNKKEPFDLNFFIIDNAFRLSASALILVLFPILFNYLKELPFLKEYLINFGIDTLNIWVGFLLGVFMDRIIIYLRNKSKINWFQAKK